MGREQKGGPDDLLTVAEASAIKSISPNSIRVAIRDGRLKAEERSFGYLIRRSDLIAWRARKRKDRDNSNE
jgi:hypothetical protein